MKRHVVTLSALAAIAAPAATAPPAAALHTARTCGSLAGYKVKARNVGCLFARRWAPRSYYHRRHPAGWRCTYASASSSIRMYCYSGSKAYVLTR
ncbi:MAG: hypothetical protein QOE65_1617 [Solirubrobacteraceae bacterium]|jgi:hypothetical protein|nr:hypothetical protein [Solirubrobacteraceae bacterium]